MTSETTVKDKIEFVWGGDLGACGLYLNGELAVSARQLSKAGFSDWDVIRMSDTRRLSVIRWLGK